MGSKNIINFPVKGQGSGSESGNHKVSKENITPLFKDKVAQGSIGYQNAERSEEHPEWKEKDKSMVMQNLKKPDLEIKQSHSMKGFQTKQSNYFPFMMSSISTGLFLLVASIVVFNWNDGEEESRGIAYVYHGQQHIIKSIQNGNRQISSIGRKPGLLEIFTFEKLQSRYNVQGEKGKLMSVVLLENQKPIQVSSFDDLIREFELLFPKHDKIQKVFEFSDNQYTYELINSENQSNSVFVEATIDEKGGLYSIYVRR